MMREPPRYLGLVQSQNGNRGLVGFDDDTWVGSGLCATILMRTARAGGVTSYGVVRVIPYSGWNSMHRNPISSHVIAALGPDACIIDDRLIINARGGAMLEQVLVSP